MKRLALAPVLLLACALQTWTVPQPMIRTTQASTVWPRMREGVQKACGGIATEFADATLATSTWLSWPGDKGVYVSRCLASQLPEEKDSTLVRLTLVVRYCPEGPPAELQSKSTPCEEVEVIPNSVKEALERVIDQFQQEVAR